MSGDDRVLMRVAERQAEVLAWYSREPPMHVLQAVGYPEIIERGVGAAQSGQPGGCGGEAVGASV